MKLGIIAAGEGSRLRQEGIAIPKPLLPIGGVPMIERIIRAAIRYGIREMFCVVNDQILPECSYLPHAYQKGDVRLVLLVQSTPSSLHSFAVLAPLLKGENFCLATSDAVFPEEQFGRFLIQARSQLPGDGLLAITRYVDDERPLYVQMEGQMRITGLNDRSNRPEWVTGGLYAFSSGVLDVVDSAIQAGTQRLRNFLRLLLAQQFQLFGFPFSKIVDVDHLSDIKAAEDLLTEEQRTGVHT